MRLGDHGGLSTIEALVALFLFGVIMNSASSVMLVAITSRSMSGDLADAMRLAQTEIEFLRNLRFADLNCNAVNPAIDPGANVCTNRNATRQDKVFIIRTTVADDTPESGAKQIATTTRWQTSRGEKQYRVETIFTEFAR